MTDSSGAIKPRVPAYKKEGNYDPPPAAVLNGRLSQHEIALDVARAPLPDGPIKTAIRGIEESPRSDSDSLVDAVGKVYRAVTAKIAYHERELQKLRDSLKPYGALAPQRQNDAPIDETSNAAIRAILDLADKMTHTGETQS
jgi:hypothetical protein